jgi:hypothetical protein
MGATQPDIKPGVMILANSMQLLKAGGVATEFDD